MRAILFGALFALAIILFVIARFTNDRGRYSVAARLLNAVLIVMIVVLLNDLAGMQEKNPLAAIRFMFDVIVFGVALLSLFGLRRFIKNPSLSKGDDFYVAVYKTLML